MLAMRAMNAAISDAEALLASLVGMTIHTLTGRPNEVLRIQGTDVIVGTEKSPEGQAVPIEWVQSALDTLNREGDVEISVRSVGYRSAFIGAVLAKVPGAKTRVNPRGVFIPNRAPSQGGTRTDAAD